MTEKRYDYLVVGSGLFGSVFAHEALKKGRRVLVLEKRDHVGGNVYSENISGIDVHKYGPHIFHTSEKKIWEYVNALAFLKPYTYSPIAKYNEELYNLPFNMNTFYQMWRVRTPQEAAQKLEEQKSAFRDLAPQNLEEQALKLVGKDIYEKLIKGYTEKQWGRKAAELPAFIIRRLPVRMTFDNNYFNDVYQGIPEKGYTELIHKLLAGIEVRLRTDFFTERENCLSAAKKIVFTGRIDQFFGHCHGHLQYRSLRFEEEELDVENYQGVAVVNYTSADVPYTRITEHKHFVSKKSKTTVISREYPQEWKEASEPYYPINDEKNNALYERYLLESKKWPQIIFGGRLATYRYLNMDQVISEALECAERELI